jgi:alpha-beta hydrolase superfamily lysophospholipase
VFFFEKKNQKTFDFWCELPAWVCSHLQKFFASFFQKRRPLFFLASLAACTADPPPPQDAAIPPDLVFHVSDGAALPARAWLPPAPWHGVVLGLHGYTDSRDGWEVAAPMLAAAGYAVFAPDQRGFGGTAARGRWPGTARLVDDAAELVAQLRARYPGAPVILMGESMGGAVGMVLAARPRPAADAYVLLAPAVWGWAQLGPALGVTLRLTDWLAPGWAPDPGPVGRDILASDNIAALQRMGRDPLTIRRARVAATKGLVDLMSAAQAAAPAVHGRVLVLAGRRDQLVPAAATAAAWDRLPASVRVGFYPHGYHLLARDTDRALVVADILSWLAAPDRWLPSGADAAAAAWRAGSPWAGRVGEWVPAGRLDVAAGRPVWPY